MSRINTGTRRPMATRHYVSVTVFESKRDRSPIVEEMAELVNNFYL